ncbi:MAG: hypothetical protein HQK54_14290, partial [Oligoflexales bacterium]|nr:hypothetical protein [Oligoflexales bacterium]
IGCGYSDRKTKQKANLSAIGTNSRWSYLQPDPSVSITVKNLSPDDPSWHAVYHIRFSDRITGFSFDNFKIILTMNQNGGGSVLTISNYLSTILRNTPNFSFEASQIYGSWEEKYCLSDDPAHKSKINPGGILKYNMRFERNRSASDWYNQYNINDCPAGTSPLASTPPNALTYRIEGFAYDGALYLTLNYTPPHTYYLYVGLKNGLMYLGFFNSKEERDIWGISIISTVYAMMPAN